jgi:type I restriction enzyme S subunit
VKDVRLAHVATQVVTPPSGKPLPFFALDHIDPAMSRLLPGIESAERLPADAGMLEAMPGDVLFGKLRPYLAKSLHIGQPSLVSGEFIAMRPAAGIDSRWLAYLALSTPFVNWAVSTSEGVRMPRTSWERLRDFRVPAVSPSRQRAIADFLDAETARIDTLANRRRRLLDRVQERLLAQALDIGSYSDHRLPLRRCLSSIKTGATPALFGLVDSAANGVPWYSPGDFSDRMRLYPAARWLSAAVVKSGLPPLFPTDCTLIIGIGATAGRVAHLDHEATGNQQVTCLVPNHRLVPRFLSWQLWARVRQIRATAPYTTLPILNNDFLKNLVISCPSISVQHWFVEMLDDAAESVRRLEAATIQQAHRLVERRQALITAAVTDQIDVTWGAA